MYGEVEYSSVSSKPRHCRYMGEQIGAPAGLSSEGVLLWTRGGNSLSPTGLEARFPGLCAVGWAKTRLLACLGLGFVLTW
jgi:hypothetical protein